MSGRHAASWAVSGEREQDAAPWHGKHRAPDPAWTGHRAAEAELASWFGFEIEADDPPRRSQPDPHAPVCPSCGHYYDAGCPCTCCPEDTP